MLQLFLPGPVSIYYGEELALPSNTRGRHRQRGLMRWSFDNATRNFGFSPLDPPYYFKTVDDTTGASMNFESEYGDRLSALNTFRLLSNLRVRDEIFQEGHFTSLKKDGLHVYKRF
ncbi:ATG-1 protein, partial [Aphelenchoides avenae]